MNLTIPHDLIDSGVQCENLDDALAPILAFMDPDEDQDLGGDAGEFFCDVSWSEVNAEGRGYILMRFAEFIINTYRVR